VNIQPEEERLALLVQRVRDGVASDAEREELALYADTPESQALITRAERDGELGRGWLQRVEADRRMLVSETSWLSKTERKLGVALVVSGMVGAVLLPPAGLAMLVAGTGILAWSVLRVAIRNVGKDPYEDVDE